MKAIETIVDDLSQDELVLVVEEVFKGHDSLKHEKAKSQLKSIVEEFYFDMLVIK